MYLAISMSYQIWAYMAIFSGTRWQRFWRASSTFAVGMVAYSILIALIIVAVLAILTARA